AQYPTEVTCVPGRAQPASITGRPAWVQRATTSLDAIADRARVASCLLLLAGDPSERQPGDREEPGNDLEQQQNQRELQRLAEAPHDATVPTPVCLDPQRELAVHRRHRHRVGDIDVTAQQVLRVEAEGEVVVGPEHLGDESADREEQPESDPVPCAEPIGERTAAQERARERGREDQGRSPRLQALNRSLLLEQAPQRFLIDEGRPGIVVGCERLAGCARHCGFLWTLASHSESPDDQVRRGGAGVLLLAGDEKAIADSRGLKREATMKFVPWSRFASSSIRKGWIRWPTNSCAESSSESADPVQVLPSMSRLPSESRVFGRRRRCHSFARRRRGGMCPCSAPAPQSVAAVAVVPAQYA